MKEHQAIDDMIDHNVQKFSSIGRVTLKSRQRPIKHVKDHRDRKQYSSSPLIPYYKTEARNRTHNEPDVRKRNHRHIERTTRPSTRDRILRSGNSFGLACSAS